MPKLAAPSFNGVGLSPDARRVLEASLRPLVASANNALVVGDTLQVFGPIRVSAPADAITTPLGVSVSSMELIFDVTLGNLTISNTTPWCLLQVNADGTFATTQSSNPLVSPAGYGVDVQKYAGGLIYVVQQTQAGQSGLAEVAMMFKTGLGIEDPPILCRQGAAISATQWGAGSMRYGAASAWSGTGGVAGIATSGEMAMGPYAFPMVFNSGGGAITVNGLRCALYGVPG